MDPVIGNVPFLAVHRRAPGNATMIDEPANLYTDWISTGHGYIFVPYLIRVFDWL